MFKLPDELQNIIFTYLRIDNWVKMKSVNKESKKYFDQKFLNMGYTDELLKTHYILEFAFELYDYNVKKIMTHLVNGEGNWFEWRDPGYTVHSTLLDYFDRELTCKMEIGYGDINTHIMPTEAVNDFVEEFKKGDYELYKHYAHCFEKIFKDRDKLLDKIPDINSNICGCCGSSDNTYITTYLKPITTYRPTIMCDTCIDKTYLTRYKFLKKHDHGSMGEVHLKNSYEDIPEEEKETPGTRIGLFYSDGIQHTEFGLEFWACPNYNDKQFRRIRYPYYVAEKYNKK